MHILLNNLNNTTEKNNDTSEGISTPHPKINEAVGKEVEEDESVIYGNNEGLFSVAYLLFCQL